MEPAGAERAFVHALRSMGVIPGFVLPDPAREAPTGVEAGLRVSIWAISLLARSVPLLWKI
jgi:hypothetical protein